jgi:hypothetical protein
MGWSENQVRNFVNHTNDKMQSEPSMIRLRLSQIHPALILEYHCTRASVQ